MAKLGILTYHRSLNYGAVMQAYALATELQKRFPHAEVEIIDYMSRRMDRYYKMITLYRGKDSILHLRERVEMYKAFQRGLQALPLSSERLCTDAPQRVERWLAGRYDVIIVGSDAVWNYNKRGLPNPYFPTEAHGSRYMSYAASCNGLGLSSFAAIRPQDRAGMEASFPTFSYIGVRDQQTEALVHALCPTLPVYHNCDPSLFLRDLRRADRSALLEKLEKKYHFDPKKPTIAYMLSNHNGAFKKELASRLRARYGTQYQTVSLYAYDPYADIPYIADLTPQEWSIFFGLCKLTISKYFHGTLFSLLNGTPVIAVGAEKTIEGLPNKITDVLERLGLGAYYFATENGAFSAWDTLFAQIDTCLADPDSLHIEERLAAERASAESFFVRLQSMLDGRDGAVPDEVIPQNV